MPARGKGVSKKLNFAKNMGLDFKKVSGETVVICVLLVILLVLVIYYVRQNSEGFQDNNNAGAKCDLYVFVADWCPHCQKAAPVVDNVKNNAPANVKVNVVNEKDDNSRELMNKYKVRGFPTILLVKADGEVVEFNEGVTEEKVNSFVANNAN